MEDLYQETPPLRVGSMSSWTSTTQLTSFPPTPSSSSHSSITPTHHRSSTTPTSLVPPPSLTLPNTPYNNNNHGVDSDQSPLPSPTKAYTETPEESPEVTPPRKRSKHSTSIHKTTKMRNSALLTSVTERGYISFDPRPELAERRAFKALFWFLNILGSWPIFVALAILLFTEMKRADSGRGYWMGVFIGNTTTLSITSILPSIMALNPKLYTMRKPMIMYSWLTFSGAVTQVLLLSIFLTFRSVFQTSFHKILIGLLALHAFCLLLNALIGTYFYMYKVTTYEFEKYQLITRDLKKSTILLHFVYVTTSLGLGFVHVYKMLIDEEDSGYADKWKERLTLASSLGLVAVSLGISVTEATLSISQLTKRVYAARSSLIETLVHLLMMVLILATLVLFRDAFFVIFFVACLAFFHALFAVVYAIIAVADHHAGIELLRFIHSSSDATYF